MYPPQAIREMLLNALVHRTYMGAPVQMRVFDNFLSIWNEGGLPIGLSISDLKIEHNSRPRNPVIANACFLAGYIDAWGRGTLKIINSCVEYGLPDPTIIEKNGGLEVSITTSNQVSNQVILNLKNYKDAVDHITKVIGFPIRKPTEKSIKKFSIEAKELTPLEYKVIAFCSQPKKRKEILENCVGVSNQTKNYVAHVEPLLTRELIQLTIKDRPKSQYQKYVVTTKGRIIIFLYERLLEESENFKNK